MTNVYRIIVAAVLAGIAVHRYAIVHTPPEVKLYHARVRVAAEDVPKRVGGWVGDDVRVPVQALTLLRPNVMISRRYVNLENGTTAGLLLVHCADAHAMAGHFPLRCYPSKGWDVKSTQRRQWKVGDREFTATEYHFSKDDVGSAESQRQIVVINFLLRPGGKLLADMNEMNKDIIGAGGQSSGAGQVQVYFDARIPQEQRDEAFVTLVGGVKPVMDAILANAVQ